MRLFAAVDIPEPVRAQVREVCQGLDGVRWVKPEQLHITLRFIGEVDQAAFAPLVEALGHVSFAPFEMRLAGVGQFPPRRDPRVLWVGAEAPETLNRLAADCERQIVSLGYPPEDKPFAAHITLARLKTPPTRAEIDRFFAQHAAFASGSFAVKEFALYSSTLAPTGATYRKERRFAAKG